jgi:hypothetical protein
LTFRDDEGDTAKNRHAAERDDKRMDAERDDEAAGEKAAQAGDAQTGAGAE